MEEQTKTKRRRFSKEQKIQILKAFKDIRELLGKEFLEPEIIIDEMTSKKHQKLYKARTKGLRKKSSKELILASKLEIQKEQEKSKRKRKKVDDSRKRIGASVNNTKTSISSRKKSLL